VEGKGQAHKLEVWLWYFALGLTAELTVVALVNTGISV